MSEAFHFHNPPNEQTVQANTTAVQHLECQRTRTQYAKHKDLIIQYLDWKCNTEAVYMKGRSRLASRKLRSFNVCSKMFHIFYQSGVVSVILFAACWGSSIRASVTLRN